MQRQGSTAFPLSGPSFQRGSWKWLSQLLVSVTAHVTQVTGHRPSCPASKHHWGVSYYLIQFSSFEVALIHRCLDLPGHLHYPVVLVTLPHGLSCRQVLLPTGQASISLELQGRSWSNVSYTSSKTRGTTDCSRWHRKHCVLSEALSLHSLRRRRLFPDWKSGK